jgi:PIN domain protein
MKKVLIDLNIILDFLNKRNFHQEAARLINMCAENVLTGYICAHEVTTLSYFLFKEQKDKNKVVTTISTLFDIFQIIPIDETILKASLLSPITDYEDAVIEVSAVRFNIDYILSRNISDFKLSRIPTYTPEQFFLL